MTNTYFDVMTPLSFELVTNYLDRFSHRLESEITEISLSLSWLI